VKRLKDFNICHYKYHQKMAKIKDNFNNMRLIFAHHGENNPSCGYQCDSMCTRPIKNSTVQGIFVYQRIHHVFKRSTNLWLQFLCPTPLGNPRVKFIYLKGECTLVVSIGFLFVIENWTLQIVGWFLGKGLKKWWIKRPKMVSWKKSFFGSLKN
jgi:hypothetical protein